jgi:16S rRNA (cytosine1402-N4)-methyltransferase
LTTGRLVASDRDAESLEMARRNTARWADRILYHQARFSTLGESLRQLGIGKVDGLLADLGVSFYQLTDAERGFSIQTDGPLDMRLDRGEAWTAADLINSSSEIELAGLIYRLGEERRSRRIARAVCAARPVRSTGQLAGVIERAVRRTGRLHPATQTFLALRLAVNQELEELETLLAQAPQWIRPGGRLVVIAFMSLEDRRVKQSFQGWARQGRAKILTRHVVRPTPAEVQRNPASRSAKLRAVEMTESSDGREGKNADTIDLV